MSETESKCNGFLETQVEELARFLNIKQCVPDMFENEIGRLRDIFDINLRADFVEDMRKEMLKDILNNVTECVCTNTPEICYPMKEDRMTV